MRAINGTWVWEASPEMPLAFRQPNTHVLVHVDSDVFRSNRSCMGDAIPPDRAGADVVFRVCLVPHAGIARLCWIEARRPTIDVVAETDDLRFSLVTGGMVLF